MGRTAARNMLGQFKPYATVPFFWTQVFNKTLRYVGHSDKWDQCIIEGDLDEHCFVAYYCRGDVIEAVATMGRDPVAPAVAELMRLNLMPRTGDILIGTVNSDDLLERARTRKKK